MHNDELHIPITWKEFGLSSFYNDCYMYSNSTCAIEYQAIVQENGGKIPYAYKFSRDFIFANFANQWAIAKIKTQKCARKRYKHAAAAHHSRN